MFGIASSLVSTMLSPVQAFLHSRLSVDHDSQGARRGAYLLLARSWR